MRSQLLAVGDTVLALDGCPESRSPATTSRCASSEPRGRPPAPPVTVCRSSPRGPIDDVRGVVATAVVVALAVARAGGSAQRSRSHPSRSPGRAAATTPTATGGSARAARATTPGTCSSRSGRGREARRSPIVMHGYGEYAGFNQLYEFIRHTVRKGSIVIYPRWQTNIATPCPGPFDIEPCMKSSLRGIRGALAYLRARPKKRVQPQLRRDELLRLLLRRHHHREPHEPLPKAAPAEAAGDLARGPARRRP